jgi:subtilisin family serine protease
MGARIAWILGIVFVLVLLGCSSNEDVVTTAPQGIETTPDLTPAATSAVPTGRTIILFHEQGVIPAAGLELVASLGGTVTTRLDGIGALFVENLQPGAMTALAASPLVQQVGPDYVMNWIPPLVMGSVVRVDGGAPNAHDPTEASNFRVWQWGPQRIAADQAWAAGYVGRPDIRVAILDTGIDFLNRELRGLVDLDRSASFVETEPTFDDLHFHGTHVASTVSTNSVTIAGIAPHVTLIAVKVLSFEGAGSFEGVSAGMMHAADVDAHVINMSLGATFQKDLPGADVLIELTKRAVDYAGAQGTVVISAAGNEMINFDAPGAPITLPCRVSHVCVSATGPLNGQFDESGPILTANHDRPAYYTNYGSGTIEVAAPGGNANPLDEAQADSTWRDEDLIVGACAGRSTVAPQCALNNDAVAFYLFAGGTSMATPHVSGVAAMIQSQAGGGLSVAQLRDRITRYADDIGKKGRDPYSNYGRVNVLRSIRQTRR